MGNSKKILGIIFMVVAALMILLDITHSGQSTSENSNYVAVTENANESPQEYKDSCKERNYETIARHPELYQGKRTKVTGIVSQVAESDDAATYYIYIGKTDYGYDYNTCVRVVFKDYKAFYRIVKNDVITVYGLFDGITSCDTVIGAQDNMPQFSAKYIELEK